MSDENKTGGQAFPAAWGDCKHGGDYIQGMTLRDWFAGRALTGFASNMENVIEPKWGLMAQDAYEIADAMLAAREISTTADKA